jgi:hypothetical protein
VEEEEVVSTWRSLSWILFRLLLRESRNAESRQTLELVECEKFGKKLTRSHPEVLSPAGLPEQQTTWRKRCRSPGRGNGNGLPPTPEEPAGSYDAHTLGLAWRVEERAIQLSGRRMLS